MTRQKVFLSGGFKSNWQEKVIERFQSKFIFFNPREHMLEDTSEYTYWDIHFIRQSDIVFAYLEKTNPSGLGLIFEIGIAYGLNKTIILVDEKSEKDEIFKKYFNIVKHASSSVFNSLEVGLKYLESFSRY
jgi:nucleoside 2-deoxyribosyltransferase